MKKRKRNKLLIRSIIFRQYFAEITLMINSGNFPLLRFSNNCFFFKKIQLISCSTLVKNSLNILEHYLINVCTKTYFWWNGTPWSNKQTIGQTYGQRDGQEWFHRISSNIEKMSKLQYNVKTTLNSKLW